MKKIFDTIIVGAGASGTFCAIIATERGRKVAVLEHNEQFLKKVAVSGGGRCNFTNLAATSEHYASENPLFTISALQQFSPQDFVGFLKKHNTSYKEKAQGQLFAQSSQEVIQNLKKDSSKVSFFFNTKITDIKHHNAFTVHTNQGDFEAKTLVIATGGASYPNLGASDFGYQIAKQFGHKIIPFKPALVPLNLDNELMKKTLKLQGISLLTQVRCNDFEIKEKILFTHFGLSGPAILQASLYWNKGDFLTINLLPEQNATDWLLQHKKENTKKKISSILRTLFPEKIVDFLLDEYQDRFIAETSDRTIKELGEKINCWKIYPVGTQSFKLAEVTKGGVDVNEISSKTMESLKIKGLYFIGEILDVTGQLGGFNLQWAWSSGWVCGKNI